MERFEDFYQGKDNGIHDIVFYVKCIKEANGLTEGRVYTTSRIKVTTHGVYVSLNEIPNKEYDASNFKDATTKANISINPEEMRFEVESKPNTFSCMVMDKNLKPVSFLDNKTQYWYNNEAFYYADFDYGELSSFYDNKLRFIKLYKIVATDIFNEEFQILLLETITIEDIKSFMNNLLSNEQELSEDSLISDDTNVKQTFLHNYYDMLNKK